ncbi:NAD(P)/FAD-dependent oxidoreductase [Rhodococcus sp. D2-41]|uniref:NAD(P)/FAD-dependent oxidoreductase n=1 Tax=Speluncibacter jeojiensis TaxID=2710754 RepID=A0A9X4RDJ3_9ACTN|nr:NAD(P)/FAD-dependent oxidoreductase [Rhodococcus sp. D2-41]MDG3014885.1 NAD(P)/FAD-dependent oxidoreductase [Corynebacteriales bacterium D3-21]
MTADVDVLIVGAGLSGVGAARHLQDSLPDASFAILEAREAIGGTWDLFRYPGVRSDSDMQTLGYRFRPWTDEKSIADGHKILEYVRDTAAETGIDRHIRFGHRVVRAEWSSAESRWTVTAEHGTQSVTLTSRFLYTCTGYYRYDEGYTPDFAGTERFRGQIVHPQHWPADLDYSGKKVVVIGSGATAVTLVPSMADDAAHVTMLQRSPTYIASLPAKDPIANTLRRALGNRIAYPISRWKNIAVSVGVYQASQRLPRLVKAILRRSQQRRLPTGYDIDTHLTPRYNPWDQRLCLVPNGDLFRAIRHGKASIATDRIATFTEAGLALESGAELEADIVVTATGLNLLVCGGIELSVDGAPVSFPNTLAYKGMMLSDVPNFVFTIGYTNASWTLKADLVAEYFCRLYARMAERGQSVFVAVNDDPALETRPLLDFEAGYVQRGVAQFPRAGSRAPWQLGMSYFHDLVSLRHGRLDDAAMRFSA